MGNTPTRSQGGMSFDAEVIKAPGAKPVEDDIDFSEEGNSDGDDVHSGRQNIHGRDRIQRRVGEA